MADSLKFGTSGLRGLAVDLQGQPSVAYTRAFVRHLRSSGLTGNSRKLYVARDLRYSSAAIAFDVACGAAAEGLSVVDCGVLPTPALALSAMADGSPAIMVTGSHIPADRNGLKFYTPRGEIGKSDEAGISALVGDVGGDGTVEPQVADGYAAAAAAYVNRYRGVLPPESLSGRRIGVFEHSTTLRDFLGPLLSEAGATIVPLGRAETFVAVDTEAFSDAIFDDPKVWIKGQGLDALVSGDGDGDRPLVMDERGDFVRGDALGLLAARFVGARSIVTPVTSNSALEGKGGFAEVVRTKVGSPFVIAGLEHDMPLPKVGFEANGGVLLGSDVEVNGVPISALPTRDAVLPILATLGLWSASDEALSSFIAGLGLAEARAGRLEHVASDRSAALIALLNDTDKAAAYFAPRAGVCALSSIDGLRFTLSDGSTVHYRASGNAPELRCYVEAKDAETAESLLAWGLAAADAVVR